jgi:CRISPR-associated protein Csb2
MIAGSPDSALTTTARWRLSHGIALTQALRVGERLRVATLGCAERIFGPDAIPWVLSGHGIPAGLSHQHAFYLSEDRDQDGWIDHVVIHAEAGLEPLALAALGRLGFVMVSELRDMWAGNGRAARAGGSLFAAAPLWISATPYLPPWPWDAASPESVSACFARECRLRGLPEPRRVEKLPGAILRAGILPAEPFERIRATGTPPPWRPGGFFALEFAAPVAGPVALGYGCHFGLGLFRPVEVA